MDFADLRVRNGQISLLEQQVADPGAEAAGLKVRLL